MTEKKYRRQQHLEKVPSRAEGCDSSSWFIAIEWDWPAAAGTQKVGAHNKHSASSKTSVQGNEVSGIYSSTSWRNLHEVTFEWDNLMIRHLISCSWAGKWLFLYCCLLYKEKSVQRDVITEVESNYISCSWLQVILKRKCFLCELILLYLLLNI